MPGKLCVGDTIANALHLQDSKAFCEGLNWRAGGTAAQKPITDNPHVSGSQSGDAWDAGWTVADDAAPGAIDPANAPCCNPPQGNVSA